MRAPSRHNIPLAPVLGVVGGLAIPALNGAKIAKGKPMVEQAEIILDQIGQGVYGYSVVNQQWYTGNLPRFWAPVAGGAIAHILAGRLGINRALSRAKLGFTI